MGIYRGSETGFTQIVLKIKSLWGFLGLVWNWVNSLGFFYLLFFCRDLENIHRKIMSPDITFLTNNIEDIEYLQLYKCVYLMKRLILCFLDLHLPLTNMCLTLVHAIDGNMTTHEFAVKPIFGSRSLLTVLHAFVGIWEPSEDHMSPQNQFSVILLNIVWCVPH